MINHSLKVAFRNLWKDRTVNLINTVGLSIGASSCFVIFLIVNYEFSFDRFQKDSERIYRIYTETRTSGVIPGVPTAIYPIVKETFSGVESVVNFHTFSADVSLPTGIPKDYGKTDKIIFTQSEYFKVFNFYEWLIGDPYQSLTEPHKVVLTESRARIYFGEVDPSKVIGREIHYQDSLILTVSGIVKDIKENTDFDFTEFVSYSTISNSWLKNQIQLDTWGAVNSTSQLFIKLLPGTSVKNFITQMDKAVLAFQKKYKREWTSSLKIQPLSDLHFNPVLGIFGHSRSIPEIKTLKLLMGIAVLILLLASVNFINLSTANASRRLKEVGVRKIIGSTKILLIHHFLVESMIIATVSVLLSIVVASISINYFADFIPPGLNVDFIDPDNILFLFIAVLAITFFACLYPIIALSSHNPLNAIKNISGNGRSRKELLRKGLTIFQFVSAQTLIIATIAVEWQVKFMINKDLGYNKESIVYFQTPWSEKKEKREQLKTRFEQLPEIQAVSSGAPPVSATPSIEIYVEQGNEKVQLKANVWSVDTSYLGFYDITLIAGRNFIPSDSTREYVVNEAFLRAVGVSDPADILGKILDDKNPIVGVVKDYHTSSLHTDISPLIMSFRSSSFIGVKFSDRTAARSGLQTSIEKIADAWQYVYPDYPFDYKFLDDTVRRFYEIELRTSILSKLATAIAICLSCLGLFGLSFFTVAQRTKEIGIRKVFGATVSNVFMSLSSEFLLLILIACIIGAPFAYLAVDYWLTPFPYRIDLTPWLFIISTITSCLIGFFTIGFHTLKAARVAPVKTLRYE